MKAVCRKSRAGAVGGHYGHKDKGRQCLAPSGLVRNLSAEPDPVGNVPRRKMPGPAQGLRQLLTIICRHCSIGLLLRLPGGAGRDDMPLDTHGANRCLPWQRFVPAPARPKEPPRGCLHPCPSGRCRSQSLPAYHLPQAPRRGRTDHTGKTRSDCAWRERGRSRHVHQRQEREGGAGGGMHAARKTMWACFLSINLYREIYFLGVPCVA